MALNLENLRKAVAEAKGDTYESHEPQLEGQAKELWEERKTLMAELDGLKAYSMGQDEIPGTKEYLRVQEIGLLLHQLESRLTELGVSIPKGIEVLQSAVGEQVDQSEEVEGDGTAKYLERLNVLITDIERIGNNFIDSSERFIRYAQNESPYGSTLGRELEGTDEFKIIQAACVEAPDSFSLIVRERKNIESLPSDRNLDLCKMKISTALEHLQIIFTTTAKKVEELLTSTAREHRRLTTEYRNDRLSYEEEDYLKNIVSHLVKMNEESKILTQRMGTHNEELI